jgi:hypothetical protein
MHNPEHLTVHECFPHGSAGLKPIKPMMTDAEETSLNVLE